MSEPCTLDWYFAVALPSTSLLFFFCIYAVFNRQRPVIAFFALLWLAALGGTITVPFAIEGGHIGPTTRYIKLFCSVSFVMNTCNDILIFLTILWEVVAEQGAFLLRRVRPDVHLQGAASGQPAVFHMRVPPDCACPCMPAELPYFLVSPSA